MRDLGTVLIGLVWVYGLTLIGFGTALALAMFAFQLLPDGAPAWVFLASFLASAAVGFLAAWATWSWQIVLWRLWAYRRTNDLDALKRSAVGASLIWPDGHFFERTEFRSKAQSKELERLAGEAEARKLRTSPGAR